MKLTIPTGWQDVTVRQFIELSKVKGLEFDELDTQLRILSILTNVEDDVFIEMPISELKKIIEKTAFIKNHNQKFPLPYKFKIKGLRFKFDWDATKLLAGEYIDIQNYIKNNSTENIHNIIAIYLKPVTMFGTLKKECYKKTSQGEWMQTLESRTATAALLLDNLKMDAVLSMSSFFLNRWEKLIKATQIYLEVQNIKAMKELNKQLSKAGLPMCTVGT